MSKHASEGLLSFTSQLTIDSISALISHDSLVVIKKLTDDGKKYNDHIIKDAVFWDKPDIIEWGIMQGCPIGYYDRLAILKRTDRDWKEILSHSDTEIVDNEQAKSVYDTIFSSAVDNVDSIVMTAKKCGYQVHTRYADGTISSTLISSKISDIAEILGSFFWPSKVMMFAYSKSTLERVKITKLSKRSLNVKLTYADDESIDRDINIDLALLLVKIGVFSVPSFQLLVLSKITKMKIAKHSEFDIVTVTVTRSNGYVEKIESHIDINWIMKTIYDADTDPGKEHLLPIDNAIYIKSSQKDDMLCSVIDTCNVLYYIDDVEKMITVKLSLEKLLSMIKN
jgi:hypothetical protein